MFTGIIQATGHIVSMQPAGGDMRLAIRISDLLKHMEIRAGDSVAVNGVCLTACNHPVSDAGVMYTDVSRETLAVTTAGQWQTGQAANLEPALRVGDPLGGHLVSGHVDGVAEIISRRQAARSLCFRLRAPASLARFIAAKGSICLDGVSLTVNAVQEADFEVNIVPHTAEVTTLGSWRSGQEVNLEVDTLARYVARLREYDKKTDYA